jgi:RHS repeat-associated protein
MSGGTNTVYRGSYAETYTPDAWGNVKESGNFSFEPTGFSTGNQIASSGYTYDTAGDLTHDAVGNSYDYNTDGTMASNGSAPFDYDAFQQRVFDPNTQTEVFYFQGRPVVTLSEVGSGGTDLIWAGGSLIAEAHGGYPQYGTPTGTPPNYRLLDPQGSLIAETNPSGTETGTIAYAPYGPVLSSSVSGDPYTYTGLYQDQGCNGYYAWHRNESAEQIRWLTPDPDNGSYDLMAPQSLNRYAYVEDNPLGATDPTGLAGGITGWGGVCSLLHDSDNQLATTSTDNGQVPLNFCNPFPYAVVYGGLAVYDLFSNNALTLAQIGDVGKYATTEVLFWINAALSIACTADNFSSSVCGPSGWTSVVFDGKYKMTGKLINDASTLVGAYLCTVGGGPSSPGCIGYTIYSVANAIFAWIWDLTHPQFTGSLLPRPSDLGGLGTSPIGIPNQNLSLKQLLGQPLAGPVPSPVSFRQ